MPTDDRLPYQRRHLTKAVGPTLRQARETRGASRAEVAAAVGIAARTLARIERGAQTPLWPTLERLCDELGVSAALMAPRWTADSMDVPTSAVVAPGVGLRIVRRDRGLTLTQLSKASGVSVATLSRYERGITASRLLGAREDASAAEAQAPPEAAWERVARTLGFAGGAALDKACLSAAP